MELQTFEEEKYSRQQLLDAFHEGWNYGYFSPDLTPNIDELIIKINQVEV